MSMSSYFSDVMEIDWSIVEEWKRSNKAEGLYFDLKSRAENGKFSEEDKKTLSKSISGFANTAGGVIAIGFRTQKRDGVEHIIDIIPIPNAAKFKADLEACLRTITDPPVSGIDVKVVDADGHAGAGIVLVSIPPSSASPHRALWGAPGEKDHYYMRLGSSMERIPHRQLSAMFGQYPPPKLQVILTLIIQHQIGAESMLNIALRIRNTGRGCAQMPGLRIYETADGPIPHYWWITLLPGKGTSYIKTWDVGMMQDFDGPAYLTLRSNADTVIYPGDEIKVAHGQAGPKDFFKVPEKCEIPFRGLIFALNSQPVAFDRVLEIEGRQGYRTDLAVPSD